MGDFSMTCSISGLGISGGTPVRCLLLTASPYAREEPRDAWIVRTPPLRAIYNGYGSIERVHADDRFIADLWRRGFREDLIEKGPGDNVVHDATTSRDMSLEEIVTAVQAGRVEVRRDMQHFWRRPLNHVISSETKIAQVLAQDALLSATSHGGFDVDEPVPHLVRVRLRGYQPDQEVLSALGEARAVIERAGFVGVVTAGSGRYPKKADLLVLAAPDAEGHVLGPQWDMSAGQAADPNKRLSIAMAMIREDVWQTITAYAHSDLIDLDCKHCGQAPWYHGGDRQCPVAFINDKPFKEHPAGTRYAHDPVFPVDLEHIVVDKTVWYGLAVFRHGARCTWHEVLDHFAGKPKEIEPSAEFEAKFEARFDALLRSLKAKAAQEAARIAALPVEERARLEAERRARAERARLEAERRARAENPCFGDFLIDDLVIRKPHRPGAWIFRASVPGVIGVSEHLSMCLVDRREVPLSTIDAIAELSAVNRVIAGIGVTWRPAESTGPQYPEWGESLRFARTMVRIAQAMDDETSNPVYAELAEVPGHTTNINASTDILLGDVVEHTNTRMRACVVEIGRTHRDGTTEYRARPAQNRDGDLDLRWWNSAHIRRVPCKDPYRRYLALIKIEDNSEQQQRRQWWPATTPEVNRRAWRRRITKYGPNLPEKLWDAMSWRLYNCCRLDPSGAHVSYDLGRAHWEAAAIDCLERRDRAARWW